jgi:hypothetical protein
LAFVSGRCSRSVIIHPSVVTHHNTRHSIAFAGSVTQLVTENAIQRVEMRAGAHAEFLAKTRGSVAWPVLC